METQEATISQDADSLVMSMARTLELFEERIAYFTASQEWSRRREEMRSQLHRLRIEIEEYTRRTV